MADTTFRIWAAFEGSYEMPLASAITRQLGPNISHCSFVHVYLGKICPMVSQTNVNNRDFSTVMTVTTKVTVVKEVKFIKKKNNKNKKIDYIISWFITTYKWVLKAVSVKKQGKQENMSALASIPAYIFNSALN